MKEKLPSGKKTSGRKERQKKDKGIEELYIFTALYMTRYTKPIPLRCILALCGLCEARKNHMKIM